MNLIYDQVDINTILANNFSLGICSVLNRTHGSAEYNMIRDAILKADISVLNLYRTEAVPIGSKSQLSGLHGEHVAAGTL